MGRGRGRGGEGRGWGGGGVEDPIHFIKILLLSINYGRKIKMTRETFGRGCGLKSHRLL